MDSFSQPELAGTEPPCAVVISPQAELRRSIIDALEGRARRGLLRLSSVSGP